MKLISIVICGPTVVVLIAFSANAWFGLSHGHPTAYGTWLHDMVMQDPGDAALLALGVECSRSGKCCRASVRELNRKPRSPTAQGWITPLSLNVSESRCLNNDLVRT